MGVKGGIGKIFTIEINKINFDKMSNSESYFVLLMISMYYVLVQSLYILLS